MPSAKPKVQATPETKLVAAVEAWAKAEEQADKIINPGLWGMVKAVNQAYLAELPVKYIRETIEKSRGAEWLETRAATLTRIMAIGTNATEADFERWAVNNIGFNRAYKEFAKPQANPAKAKAKPDVVPVPVRDPDEPRGATTKRADGSEESIREQEENPIADPVKAKAATPKPDEKTPSPAIGWAEKIDRSQNLWGELMDELISRNLLVPLLLLQSFNKLQHKQPLRAENFIEELLQTNEEAFKQAKQFIEENGQLW